MLREPSGNLADAEEIAAEEKPLEQPAHKSIAEVVAKAKPEEEMAPLIPRKRGRKAVKEGRNVRQRSMEPEPDQPPIPRLTRAAIKAEEEAQDTMDVLMALTGDYNSSLLSHGLSFSPRCRIQAHEE